MVASISGSTLWRWLHQDAIRPWYHRSWIFPRDPNFAEKAGRTLDLYAREWQGKPLQDDEFVISADEKTSIQARRRKHPTRACRPRGSMQVEHEYFRCGAWTYIAGLDVHHARIFGRCEEQNGIEPFDRLVEQVMTRPPYNAVQRCSPRLLDCRQLFGSPRLPRSGAPAKSLPKRGPGSRADPCQLAQPGGDLLLHHPAEGLDAQRFPGPGQSGRAPSRLSILLGSGGKALRMEVHSARLE